MSKVAEVLEIVKGLTVLELAELVKAFEEEFGVSAAAPGSCCCCCCCWRCCCRR